MQDLGEAKTYLGLGVARKLGNQKLSMSQEKYTKTVLERFIMEKSKHVATSGEKILEFDQRSESEMI